MIPLTLTLTWWYRRLDIHSSLSSCHMTSYLDLDLLLMIQEVGHPIIFVIISHDLLPRPWPSPDDTGCWTPNHLRHYITWPLTSTLTFSWWYRMLDTHSSLSSCHMTSYLDLDLLLVIQEAGHQFIFVIMSHDPLPRPWPSPGDTGGWTPIHLCHHVTWPLTSTLTFSWWYRRLDTNSSLSSCHMTSYLDLDLLLVIQEAGHPFIFIIMLHLTSTLTFSWWYRRLDTNSSLSSCHMTPYLDLDLLVIQEARHPFIFVIMSHDLLPRPWPSPGDTGGSTPIHLYHHVTWPLTSTLTFSWWYRRLDTHSSLSSCHMTSHLDLDLLLMIQEAGHSFIFVIMSHDLLPRPWPSGDTGGWTLIHLCHHVTWPLTSTLTTWWYRRLDTHSSSSSCHMTSYIDLDLLLVIQEARHPFIFVIMSHDLLPRPWPSPGDTGGWTPIHLCHHVTWPLTSTLTFSWWYRRLDTHSSSSSCHMTSYLDLDILLVIQEAGHPFIFVIMSHDLLPRPWPSQCNTGGWTPIHLRHHVTWPLIRPWPSPGDTGGWTPIHLCRHVTWPLTSTLTFSWWYRRLDIHSSLSSYHMTSYLDLDLLVIQEAGHPFIFIIISHDLLPRPWPSPGDTGGSTPIHLCHHVTWPLTSTLTFSWWYRRLDTHSSLSSCHMTSYLDLDLLLVIQEARHPFIFVIMSHDLSPRPWPSPDDTGGWTLIHLCHHVTWPLTSTLTFWWYRRLDTHSSSSSCHMTSYLDLDHLVIQEAGHPFIFVIMSHDLLHWPWPSPGDTGGSTPIHLCHVTWPLTSTLTFSWWYRRLDTHSSLSSLSHDLLPRPWPSSGDTGGWTPIHLRHHVTWTLTSTLTFSWWYRRLDTHSSLSSCHMTSYLDLDLLNVIQEAGHPFIFVIMSRDLLFDLDLLLAIQEAGHPFISVVMSHDLLPRPWPSPGDTGGWTSIHLYHHITWPLNLDLDLLVIQEAGHPFIFIIISHDLLPRPWPSPGDTGGWTPIHLCHHVTWPLTSTLTFSWWYRRLDIHSSWSSCHMTSYLDLDLHLMIQEAGHPFIFIIMSHDLLPWPWPSPGDTGGWTSIHLCHHVTWPLDLDLLLVIQEARHPFIFVVMSHDLLPRPWPFPDDTGGWTSIHLCHHVTWPLTSTLTFSWWYRGLDTHSSLSSCQMTSYLDLDLLVIQEAGHQFIFVIMSHDLLPRPWPSPDDTGRWTPIHLGHHVTWPLTSTLTFSWWYRSLDTHSSLSSCHMTSYLDLDLLLMIQEPRHPFIFIIMSHDLLPRPWPFPDDTGA